MKRLIRPCLLMIARLGLFLAVVAWIVGQSWTVLACADPVVTFLGNADWIFGYEVGVGYLLQRYPNPSPLDYDIKLLTSISQNPIFDEQTRIPGVVYSRVGTDAWIALRHWLVVSFLTAINVALHFICRTRGAGGR